MSTEETVPSTDGVAVALHDLGGAGPPLLLCHPTGFHGLVWAPLAAELAPHAHCWSLDFRGHGDSTAPLDGDYDWTGMGDDVLAVADHLGLHGAPAVGHSMGGAALVVAELARPGTFRSLWLFEPILFPRPEGEGPVISPMADAARRRRDRFPDRDAAYAHYAAKPPLARLAPAALRAYVDHGFRDVDGGVDLKCRPETEAAVFQSGMRDVAFSRLGELRCPVTVAVGGEGWGPAQAGPIISEAIPGGRLERFGHLSHFGPLEDPAAVAATVAADLGLP